MGHSYKGASVSPGRTSPWSAPVLTSNVYSEIEWTYPPTTLPYWLIFRSTEPTGPFALVGTLPGTERLTASIPPNFYAQIQGVAIDKSPLTRLSNIIRVNNTPSAPVAADAGGGTLQWAWGGSEPDFWWIWSATFGIALNVGGPGTRFYNMGNEPDTQYVFGADAFGTPQTPNSNTVTLA